MWGVQINISKVFNTILNSYSGIGSQQRKKGECIDNIASKKSENGEYCDKVLENSIVAKKLDQFWNASIRRDSPKDDSEKNNFSNSGIILRKGLKASNICHIQIFHSQFFQAFSEIFGIIIISNIVFYKVPRKDCK